MRIKQASHLYPKIAALLNLPLPLVESTINHFLEDLSHYRMFPTHPIYRVRYLGAFYTNTPSINRALSLIIKRMRTSPDPSLRAHFRNLWAIRHSVYKHTSSRKYKQRFEKWH